MASGEVHGIWPSVRRVLHRFHRLGWAPQTEGQVGSQMRRLKRLGLIALIATVSTVAMWGAQADTDNDERIQTLLAAAQQAIARKDFSSAAEAYRRAAQISPQTAELWADLGLMYHETGNFSEAIKSFTEAARLNPSLYVPQLFLGIDFLELNQAGSAIPFLQKAEGLNPIDAQVPLALGHAFSIAGNANRATDAFWRAVVLAPRNGNGWLDLGKAYLQQVDADALVLTSTYKDSNYSKLRAGELFAEQGKLINAARAYQDALAGTSLLPCSHAGYGIVLLRQKEIIEAKAEFDRESKSNSGCPLTQIGLAALKLVQSDNGTALEYLISIWKADDSFFREGLPSLRDAITDEQADGLLDLAKDWQANGKIPASLVNSIQAGLQLNDSTAEILGRIAADTPDQGKTALPPLPTDPEKFYLSGQFRKCAESMRLRLKTLPERYLLVLAPCAFYAGDYRTASLAARRLATNSPTRKAGLYWESKAGQKLAIAALTQAGQIDANSPGMHVLLGDVYRQKRSWEDAESEYRMALVLEPDDRKARLGLVTALAQDGNREGALSAGKDLLLKNPDDPEANLLVGEILIQQHEFAEAEDYLNRVHGIQPRSLPHLHGLLGEVYANTDRVPEALSELKLGLADDEDGSLHFQLGCLYKKTGDKKKATEAFRASQQLRKTFDDRSSVVPQQSIADISQQ